MNTTTKVQEVLDQSARGVVLVSYMDKEIEDHCKESEIDSALQMLFQQQGKVREIANCLSAIASLSKDVDVSILRAIAHVSQAALIVDISARAIRDAIGETNAFREHNFSNL